MEGILLLSLFGEIFISFECEGTKKDYGEL